MKEIMEEMDVVSRSGLRRSKDGCLRSVGEGMPIGGEAIEGLRVVCAVSGGGKEWLVGTDAAGDVYAGLIEGEEMAKVAEGVGETYCGVETGEGEVTLMTSNGRRMLDYDSTEGWTDRGVMTGLPEVEIEDEATEKLSRSIGSLELGIQDLRGGLTERARNIVGKAVARSMNSLLREARRAGVSTVATRTRWIMEDKRGNIIATGAWETAGGVTADVVGRTTIGSGGKTGALEIGITPTRIKATASTTESTGGNWANHIGRIRIEREAEPIWRVEAEDAEWRIENPASGEAELVVKVRRPVIEMDEPESGGYAQELNEAGFIARVATKHGDTIVWGDIENQKTGERRRGTVATSRSGKGLTLTDAQDCGEPGIKALAGGTRRGGTWGAGCGHVYGLTSDGVLGITVSGAGRKLSISKLAEGGLEGSNMACAATRKGVAFASSGGREIALVGGTSRETIATAAEKVAALGYDAVRDELTAWYESGDCETFELSHKGANGEPTSYRREAEMPTGIVCRKGMLITSGSDGSLTDIADERLDRNGSAELIAETSGQAGENGTGIMIEAGAELLKGSIEIGAEGGRSENYSPIARYEIEGALNDGMRFELPLPRRQKIRVTIKANECRKLKIGKIWIIKRERREK